MPRLTSRVALAVMSVALLHCSGGSSGSTPPTYSLGGQVSGLAGSGLVLRSSLGESLPVTASGPFAFATKAVSGTAYEVSVSVQPSTPSQTCSVANGAGTIGSADVTSVSVTCTTNAYTVGGTVSGLDGTLVLRNGGDTVEIAPGTGSVAFTFATPVQSGAPFVVEVETQPSEPAQTCEVTGGTGTVAAGDVTTVSVNCLTDAFTIGGTVSGLAAPGLELENGGEQIAVNANGSFAFPTPILSGLGYAVSVVASPTSPVWQLCEIDEGTASGTVGAANVTSVVVRCTSHYTLGGTVAGMLQPGLVLQSGDEQLELDSDGPFTFGTRLPVDAEYLVTVAASPPTESCSVSNEAGTIAADVTDVTVTCACRAGVGDCDGVAGNGCETDVRASLSHCGACDNPCSYPHAAETCSDAVCVMGACDAGFADCNGATVDGCETNVKTPANCGACGMKCSPGQACADPDGNGTYSCQ